jgi:hypothetical protein
MSEKETNSVDNTELDIEQIDEAYDKIIDSKKYPGLKIHQSSTTGAVKLTHPDHADMKLNYSRARDRYRHPVHGEFWHDKLWGIASKYHKHGPSLGNPNVVAEQIDEGSAADTLHPGAGSGGGDTKAETLATFTSLLAQLGKEDLSNLFNDVQAQFGANKAPGAVDNSAKNRSTVDAKPSAAQGTGAWKEDIDDMFGGDELTEDFREKASIVFEAAVNTRITLEETRLQEEFEAVLESLEEEYETKLQEEASKVFEDVSAKLDQYLDYVVENWMEENQLAVESTLRADIAENFIQGLQGLFSEHYIRVPDEQIDLVAEMKAELDELKEKLNETIDTKLELEGVIEEATKEATLEEVSEGLAVTQAEKLRTLSEGIEYTDADSYRRKLEIVKENYFNKKSASTGSGFITEEIDGDDGEEKADRYTAPGMDMYMNAIKKSVK